jgi:hypothetical protein
MDPTNWLFGLPAPYISPSRSEIYGSHKLLDNWDVPRLYAYNINGQHEWQIRLPEKVVAVN